MAQIEGTDFAIADTSTVDKIFIADMDGGQVTLTRPTQGSLWDVNGQFKAREDAVNLLLKTFHRARVQGRWPRRHSPTSFACFPPVARRSKSTRAAMRLQRRGTLEPRPQVTPAPTWFSKPRKAEAPALCRAHGGIHGIPQHEVFHFRAGMASHGDFQLPGPITCRRGGSHPEEDGQSYALSANDAGALTLSDLEGNPLLIATRLAFRNISFGSRKCTLKPTDLVWNLRWKTALRNASAAFELTAMGKDGRRDDIFLHWKLSTD